MGAQGRESCHLFTDRANEYATVYIDLDAEGWAGHPKVARVAVFGQEIAEQ